MAKFSEDDYWCFTMDQVDGVRFDSWVSGSAPMPSDGDIEGALVESQGKVATAARALGIHRNQLRRWLEKYGIDPKQFGPPTS